MKFGLFDKIIFKHPILQIDTKGKIIGIENLGYSQDIYFVVSSNKVEGGMETYSLNLVIESDIVSSKPSPLCTDCKLVCRLKDLDLCDYCNVDKRFKFPKHNYNIFYPGEKKRIGEDEYKLYGVYYSPFLNVMNSTWSSRFPISKVKEISNNPSLYSSRVIVPDRYEDLSSIKYVKPEEEKIAYLLRKIDQSDFKLDNRVMYLIFFSKIFKNQIPTIVPSDHVKKMEICERCIFSDCLTCKVKLYV